jgi:protein-disulfide isomerase
MKGTMNRCIRILLIAGLTVASLSATAQQTTTPTKDAQAKSSPEASTAKGSTPTEATFNSFLKQMFGWNTDLTWKVADIKPSEAAGVSEATVVFNTPRGPQVTRIYVTADQKYAFTGDLVPFGADPFAESRADLKNANGPARGPADAGVTIVEFGDLECPACKAAQPNIAKLMSEEPKAKLIFQNFPLEQVHKWAMTAAKYTDCLGRQNQAAMWKFIDTVYEHQGDVTEQNVDQMLKGYVKDSGGDPDAVSVCAAKPDTEKRVRDSMALGDKLGITSTPTFFVNGRKIVGFGSNIPFDSFKSIVDYDLNNTGK